MPTIFHPFKALALVFHDNDVYFRVSVKLTILRN